jgi:hypothetical protein
MIKEDNAVMSHLSPTVIARPDKIGAWRSYRQLLERALCEIATASLPNRTVHTTHASQ